MVSLETTYFAIYLFYGYASSFLQMEMKDGLVIILVLIPLYSNFEILYIAR